MSKKETDWRMRRMTVHSKRSVGVSELMRRTCRLRLSDQSESGERAF